MKATSKMLREYFSGIPIESLHRRHGYSEKIIQNCAQFVDEVEKDMPSPITRNQHIGMMRGSLPTLKRWRTT